MTKIKKLPRNDQGQILREFNANGKKYTIRSSEEGIGIYRFSELQKMGLVIGYNATFQQFDDNLLAIENLQLSDEPSASIKKKTMLHTQAMREGIVKVAKTRYQKAFYMCTLFIVREGEDETQFNSDEAQSKIDDWNTEGYDAGDFLALALNSIPNFLHSYKEVNQRILDMNLNMTAMQVS